MRIFFQNPTKDPLITVSFGDDTGASLAFVPAAMDCAAKTGAVTTGGAVSAPVVTIAAIVGGLVPGDSSPHHLLGINRFATLASATATPDGVPATSDASPAGPAAVGLPGDATPTTAAEVNPLDGLADVLKTWDGVSPLEIAGFKFEKVADTDGKPTIKITITTDNVQDIINVARTIQTAFPEESHNLTIDVTHPNMGKALLRWGHRYFDGIIAEIVASRDQVLAMNEKVSRDEPLTEDERALAEKVSRHILGCNRAFVDDREMLEYLFNRLSQESQASQYWPGFIHDSGRRGKNLNTIWYMYESLLAGKSARSRHLEQLNHMGENSLQYAIGYALSLAITDLQQNSIQTAWHFNGNADIPLANEEHLDTFVDILANLISNAARYSNPQRRGEVHITVRRTDDGIEIEVRDNGIGIPADKLNDIGQFGFRVGEKPVDGSHGHGLWQTKQNLEDLGWGPLHIESTHGEGSRFRFTIPNSDARK